MKHYSLRLVQGFYCDTFVQEMLSISACFSLLSLCRTKKHSVNTLNYTPALVAASSGLPPAGGARRGGGGRSSRQSRGGDLRDLLGLSSSDCFPSTSHTPHRSSSSPQGLVDAALPGELPADLLHRLTNNLVLKLHKEGKRDGKRVLSRKKVLQFYLKCCS